MLRLLLRLASFWYWLAIVLRLAAYRLLLRAVADEKPVKMEAVSASISALENNIADPAFYERDPKGFQKTIAALDRERATLAAMEEEWLELEMLREEIEGEFWLGLSGLVSILFGMFIIARPGEGALAVIWIIGAYAIIFGVFLISFAFRIKGHGKAA